MQNIDENADEDEDDGDEYEQAEQQC